MILRWIISAFVSGLLVQATAQTVFDPGDVVILGVNANNSDCGGSTSGEDVISFVCFKDLTPGTTLDFTDNGWERANAGFWGTTEGVIRITRTGTTIPAGTVITMRINNNSMTGLSPDAMWNSAHLSGGAYNLNLNNSGDQIFIMQGGSWTTGGSPHFGTYSGNVLFSFSTTGWSTFTGTPLSPEESAIYPGMICLSLAPTITSDFNKYTGDLTPTTQRIWLGRVSETTNWSSFGNCAAYNAGLPLYQTGFSIGILPGGFEEGYWLGIDSNEWFDCENWENLRVPEEDTDVLLRPLDNDVGPFEHAQIAGLFAECRSLDIQSGGQLTISPLGELTVYENIRNNGILNSTGSIVLEGAMNSVLWGASGINVRTLELNKSGGAAIFTDTVITITANGDLNFNTGIITPVSGDRVVFQTNAEANGASNASYVEGVVIKEGNEDFIFPVGDGFYQPIGLENIGTFNSVFEAEFIDANGPGMYNYNWEPSINNVATCSYWMLNLLNGTNAEVRLSWGNDNDCGITDPAGLVVSKFDGSQWLNHGQQGFSGNSVAGSVLSSDLITEFGAFALASTTGFNPLPVEWLEFNANMRTGNTVLLNWSTASETNNDYFSIEHSTNGLQFHKIHNITGAGNSSTVNTYEWIHHHPPKGLNYYRLKQVDFNGEFEYSEIRTVKTDGAEDFELLDFGTNLYLHLSKPVSEMNYYLFDTAGKIISGESLGSGKTFEIETGNLAPGIYLIRISADHTMIHRRILR